MYNYHSINKLLCQENDINIKPNEIIALIINMLKYCSVNSVS